MYVAALNQDAPEYATAVEAGSTDALYSAVSLKDQRRDGGENHYDMSAPGEKSRGKNAKLKQQQHQQPEQQQHQQQQQQEAPTMVYDVAQHASGSGGGGGSAAAPSQLAEYSHLAPRNDCWGGNNVYDLGPLQRNKQQ